jgi:peptidoglycan/xylan/chitin deacetylase (PgdA/CDA1 family)
MLTFDLDAETMWTARDPKNAERPILMSQGAYGWKVGVDRVLGLLARYGLKSTFFVPGIIIEQRPAVVERILGAGHEVAHHSYSHAWIVNLTPEQEREEMQKGFEIIERFTGRAPAGYRSPAAEFSAITLPLIKEYGFRYSSNFFDDDFTLPGRTMHPPSAVREAWIAEFDTLYAEDRQMMVAMHPEIIGQPSRLVVLDGLIQHVLKHKNVWIGRCDEIAADMLPRLKAVA